jgi:ApeA N-terminal domain 1/Apea-like HEPN
VEVHAVVKSDQPKRAGKFILGPEKEIYGELILAGAKTSLYLQDRGEFSTHAIPDKYIKGVLHDLTKVSLIRCVTMSGPGYAARGGEEYHFTRVFPHFVVYGDTHIAPSEKTIVKVHCAVDDATTLFYDFDAFGLVLDGRPFIDKIVEANANIAGRKISTGPEPQILYFTGKREIFAAETAMGRVSASHNPRPTSFGGPSGVGLKNTIFVTIEFGEAVVFEEAVVHTSTLLTYLAILAGRPQNVVALELEVKAGQRSSLLQVHWSMCPKYESRDEGNKPHPSDVLLDAVRQPDEFSRVLANWLARDLAWQDARLRFSNSFAQENHYTVDRLIGAANVFDILPKSAVGPAGLRPKVDKTVRKAARNRETKLMRKVRHVAKKIIGEVGGRFPDLLLVTDEAVNCRDYYVHGGRPRFDYNRNFDTVVFLTNALEFVFAVSDLIEAGWDIKAWSNAGTTMSHPFARFRVGYSRQLAELKALLPT